MSGAKTRIGFSGDGSEPPDSDEARGARTVMGRDMHLHAPPVPQGPVSPRPFPAMPAPAPRAPVPVPHASAPSHLTDEITAELPSRRVPHPEESRLARFLGRWTKSGRFVSQSQLSRHGADVEAPRAPLGRNLLLVFAVAIVTFVLTLVGVKVHQHVAGDARPKAVERALPRPSPAPTPAPATPGAVPPAPVPLPGQVR